MHSLRISRSSRKVFSHEVGFGNPNKIVALRKVNKDTQCYKDHFNDAVESLVLLGYRPVFDLTEPVTSHFTANGIVVHNCSEYLHLNNTSCNLSSFNLFRFFNAATGEFDATNLRHAARLAMICADLNIERGGFPTPEIAEGTYRYRTGTVWSRQRRFRWRSASRTILMTAAGSFTADHSARFTVQLKGTLRRDGAAS